MCRVVVETPVNLSAKQKDMLREFDQSLIAGNDKHSPRSQSWMDGVKKFFDGMKF